jgi:hypothetical protein
MEGEIYNILGRLAGNYHHYTSIDHFLDENETIRISSLKDIEVILKYLLEPYQTDNHIEVEIENENIVIFHNFIMTLDEIKLKMLDFYSIKNINEFYDHYTTKNLEIQNIFPDILFVKFLKGQINCRNCCYYNYPCDENCDGFDYNY